MKRIYEDTSKMLREASPQKIKLLLKNNIGIEVSSVQDKIALTEKWFKLGKPQDLLPNLATYLGDYWEAYTHLITEKLLDLPLQKLIRGDHKEIFQGELPEGVKPIAKVILDKKLGEELNFQGITSLSSDRKIVVDTKNHKVIDFLLKSKYVDFNVIKISLVFENFTYKCNISFLNGLESSPIKPESLKDIKRVMYEMSEKGNWKLELIDQIIPLIRLEDLVQDCFIDNIIDYSKTISERQ